MNITQDVLINQIAEKADLNPATVRQVIKSAEMIIFDHLSSISPIEEVNLKLLNGFNIKRKYIQKKKYSKGMFQNLDCPEHVNVKAYLSKYYNDQINQQLFHQ
ncbi:MAG: hypothetical protein K2J95_01930 [Lachnospiraceae bacterium]|nr:hypothetical protein [Lachnospiraceae bacterium]